MGKKLIEWLENKGDLKERNKKLISLNADYILGYRHALIDILKYLGIES